MNNQEINLFIKNYLETDKTSSAIMISAPWGTGKSFYISNCLIPFVESNCDYKCIVVSTYGLSSINELAQCIYSKNSRKTLSNTISVIHSELANGGFSDKASLAFNNIDLSFVPNNTGFLYSDLDLNNKLLILEDVERSSINILEILGYVNSLTEYNSAKIVMVANEEKLISYKQIEKDKKSILVLTEEAEKYIKVKEKTIRDTIKYLPDIVNTIESVFKQFEDTNISKFIENRERELTERVIIDVLGEVLSSNRSIGLNLRSIIFALEKTKEMFDRIDFEIKGEFFEELVLGNIAFCLKWKNDNTINWNDGNANSLACKKHGLLKCSYDFIVNQEFDVQGFKKAQKQYFDNKDIFQKNDKLKTVLGVLYDYYEQTEKDVKNSIVELIALVKGGSVPSSEYGKIANYLLSIKYTVRNFDEIGECLNYLLDTADYNDEKLSEYVTYHSGIQLESAEANNELHEFKSKLLERKKQTNFLGTFNYEKEQLQDWLDYIHKEKDSFIEKRGFAKFINVDRFIDLLKKLSAKEIDDVRGAFHRVYSFSNLWDYFKDDLETLKNLELRILEMKAYSEFDNVQRLQIKWFYSNVKEFVEVISHD